MLRQTLGQLIRPRNLTHFQEYYFRIRWEGEKRSRRIGRLKYWLDHSMVGDGWMEWSSLLHRLYPRHRLRSARTTFFWCVDDSTSNFTKRKTVISDRIFRDVRVVLCETKSSLRVTVHLLTSCPVITQVHDSYRAIKVIESILATSDNIHQDTMLTQVTLYSSYPPK